MEENHLVFLDVVYKGTAYHLNLCVRDNLFNDWRAQNSTKRVTILDPGDHANELTVMAGDLELC